MFFEPMFWKAVGVAAVGVLVGLVCTTIVFSVYNRYYRDLAQRAELLLHVMAISLLAASAVTVWVTYPLSGWWEIGLIGLGLSGLAGRWLGIPTFQALDKWNIADTKARWIVILIVPMLVVGIASGIANACWLHVQ